LREFFSFPHLPFLTLEYGKNGKSRKQNRYRKTSLTMKELIRIQGYFENFK
jgi:hypothetical protein